MTDDPDVLYGLSEGELEALADGLLAPSLQLRLDDLIARAKESRLSGADEAELDSLLTRVDQLTLLKTRARYTLQRRQAGVTSR
ncbi:MAG TPA: hypothetical protein PLF81_18730 [Candidatus Anammoximicrobium sp.]|nr:hypothetical protein [Candidatus Anammoximicrobium sp.]